MKRSKDASVGSNEGHVVNRGGLAENLLSLDRRMGMLSEKIDSIEQQLGFVLVPFEQPDNVLEENVATYSPAVRQVVGLCAFADTLDRKLSALVEATSAL